MTVSRSLNQLLWLRRLVTGLRKRWLERSSHISIHPSSSVSLSSRMVTRQGGDIIIGAETLIAFKTLLLAVELATGKHAPIVIGKRCFIGGGSIVMPGVSIHDEVIVAAGAVVFDDVPTQCIVAGNPAKIIRRNIEVGRFGRLEGADDASRRLWKP